jgi:hypothetical protein
MKVIKYNLCTIVTRIIVADEETEAKTVTEEILTPVTLGWSEANEEIAKKEAYKGEYTIEDDGVEKTPAEQIAELKRQLSATDYKVIKCAECQLLGEAMPYDVEALHAERQAIRDEINRLETSGSA